MKTLIFACLFFIAVPAIPARAYNRFATVKSRTLASQLTAYAEVVAIRTITVRAMVDGTVTGFRVVPGMAVRKDEVLADLTGPEYATAVRRAHFDVVRAQTAFNLAQKTALSVKQTYPDLSTRQQLEEARAAVADARTDLQDAHTRLRYLHLGHLVRTPVDASVLATFVANGERVAANDPLVRLQPRGALWLRAVFYGKDIGILHTGMQGVFRPAAGGRLIPMTVRTIIDPLRPDGGRGVACVPTNGEPAWYSGEMGTLQLNGPRRDWAVVPTTALILYQGQWWVLVHDAKGDHRQAVVPGPTLGNITLLAKGVKPGQQVVVTDAYLRFHREFSHLYQPLD